MDDRIAVTGEWYFIHEDGSVEGPFFNGFPAAGLAWIADRIQGGSAPYLVVGDDTAEGYIITEVFRKPVSVVNRDGAVIRFRTQLLPSECNGDHQKVSIFVEGADAAGTGTMLNLLKQPWSKAVNTSLTIECRITVQEVV